MSPKYQPVIGLEVHVELYTKSKMFCQCSTDYFGREPNTHICPVCLGLPGALPVPNQLAIEWCALLGLALNCAVLEKSKFDRKNYFYPDLPKGYQISQYDQPICANGSLTLSGGKKIRITRVHMEEDTGKLTHAEVGSKKVSLIDFNRSGVPLVEIVTEPDFENVSQVVEYLKRLQQIVRYLKVSSADMEKGDMRLEPNISLRKKGDTKLPDYKVEVKNINSFKFVQKAIEYEIKRQEGSLLKAQTPIQETRGWNSVLQKTVSQRTKEYAHDYRYFPEPDIPPMSFPNDYVKNLKSKLPEFAQQKKERFISQYNLTDYQAEILTRSEISADFFEDASKAALEFKVEPERVALEIINKKPRIEEILPATFIKQTYSSRQVFTIDEDELIKVVEEVLAENKKAVEDYKKGRENAIMFLVGQVIRKMPKRIETSLIKDKIQKLIK